MTARELTTGIWLVGSGEDPGALSDPHDCHVFVIDGGSEAALVDCGTGLATDAILATIEGIGLCGRIGHILVTHYHADHAGGAAELRARTGARVYASAGSAAAMATADEETTQVGAARAAGVYPADYSYPACPVDVLLADGDRVGVGDVTVTAHATPGHCDGHLALLAERQGHHTLFSGDCVFHGGTVSVQPIPDCRPHAYAHAVRRLAALPVDALLPGHGPFAVTDGAQHLSAAREQFDRLAVPPNLAPPSVR